VTGAFVTANEYLIFFLILLVAFKIHAEGADVTFLSAELTAIKRGKREGSSFCETIHGINSLFCI
jgi:hypothetical protein